MNNAFCGASQMTYDATDNPNLSSVSDMGGMFRDTSFNGDLYSWNISSVNNTSYMFDSASHFNGDLSSWDVSLITDMSRMFSEASSFNGDLSSWDVSSVTSMSNMFFSAFDFNGDLSSWDVSSVTSMSNMFFFASSFNGDLSSWDVSSVDNMSNMFTGAYLFQQNLGNWYVVPADTTYVTSEGTLNVTTISAQNAFLDDRHSPSYGIDSGDGGNSNLFNITGSNTLMFKNTPSTGAYIVNVTASVTDVFSNGNNWRLLEIRVTDQTTDTTPPSISEAAATYSRHEPWKLVRGACRHHLRHLRGHAQRHHHICSRGARSLMIVIPPRTASIAVTATTRTCSTLPVPIHSCSRTPRRQVPISST